MLSSIIISIVVFSLLFGKPIVNTIRTIRTDKKIRADMFEQIAKEWLSRVNAESHYMHIDRDPERCIQERFSKSNNEWLILVPACTAEGKTKFQMVIGVTNILSDPKPHVKTILMDLIIITNDRFKWWLEGHCIQVFTFITDTLSTQGVIFDIQETDPT